MEYRDCIMETRKAGGFSGHILLLYEKADEPTRMDLYMTYRELRDKFEEIEATSG